VTEKRVLLEEFPIAAQDHAGVRIEHPPRQVQDPRVRRALNFAFDFEK